MYPKNLNLTQNGTTPSIQVLIQIWKSPVARLNSNGDSNKTLFFFGLKTLKFEPKLA
jgi:hypothetical protein